jgi:RimJ/RimL family protein N-acetyltransferase
MKARIFLEKMTAKDFEAFYALAGNSKVMEMITGKPQTREEALRKFKSLLGNNRWKESLGSFMVFEQASSQLLGFAKLELKGANQKEAELGYSLLPEFWGKGFGSEIAEQLMKVAESDPDLTRIYADVDPSNMASKKILLRLGFVPEQLNEINGLPNETFGRQLHP